MNSLKNIDWRRGEKNAHCRYHEEENKDEPVKIWAWVFLAVIFVGSYALRLLPSAVVEEEYVLSSSSGALAPDEIVFPCREDGKYIVVTAAIHFGEKTISESVFVDDGSVHCVDGFVDRRDVAKMGGPDEILRFLPWKEEIDPGVAETASYSRAE